jgi:hypothetical protein
VAVGTGGPVAGEGARGEKRVVSLGSGSLRLDVRRGFITVYSTVVSLTTLIGWALKSKYFKTRR